MFEDLVSRLLAKNDNDDVSPECGVIISGPDHRDLSGIRRHIQPSANDSNYNKKDGARHWLARRKLIYP